MWLKSILHKYLSQFDLELIITRNRALYFGHLKIALLLIRAGALIADEGNDWRTDIYPRRQRWRSIRNLTSWRPNIDHDGLSPLDLLSSSLKGYLDDSRRDLKCTSVLSFGKADFILGISLPNGAGEVLRPRLVEAIASESVVQVLACKYHSLALTKDGSIYAWGHGRSGRLGMGDENIQPEPRILSRLLGYSITMIAAGENHSLAMSNVGAVFSWGSDRFGQLGHGGSETGKIRLEPKRIENLKKLTVIAIAASDTHSLCFTSSDELFAWGSNKEGQLGLNASEIGAGIAGCPGIAVPKRVNLRGLNLPATAASNNTRYNDANYRSADNNGRFIQIAAARHSTLLLCRPLNARTYPTRTFVPSVNEVYQWGHGYSTPSKVTFPRGGRLAGMSGGGDSSGKSIDEQYVRFFGNNATAAVNVVQVSAGLFHNVAISSDGCAYTW